MSENVKHTPGPWVYYADLPSTEPNWHIVTTANKMRVIANIHIEPGNAMDEANARLIAAAPDFLAASEALLIAWRKLIDSLRQDDRIEEIEFNEFMALRSAVANARGIHSWEVHKHLQDMEARP